jgi:hypothetical protein
MVTSLTTGFLKRGKENRENLAQNQLQNENSEKLISELGGVKEAVKSLDKKTPALDLDAESAKKAVAKGGVTAGAAGAAGGKPVTEGGVADIISDNLGTVVASGVAGGGVIATAKALGTKYKALAGKLTGGVLGKVLSKANPVISAALVGKDVFDIANAVTDDDVKTAVKNEDIGGVIGGILGGALGFALGGPAGAALGAGLGNMAGEFIGGAMDDPEIVTAIQTVKDELTAEKSGLVSEINIINEKLKDKNISAEMKALYEEQLKQNNARIKSIDGELESMKVLDADIKALDEIDKRATENRKEKTRLENALRIAEEKGDSARIAALEKMIAVNDEEFEKAEEDYAKQAELLRTKARETTKTLADKSTSFFDKIATEGGFFGSVVSFLGLGDSLEGAEMDNYLKGEAEKELAELKAYLSKIESQKINKFVAAGPGSLNFQQQQIKRTSHLIAKKEKEIEGMKGLARGGFVVNQPSYLPGSGVVVGEHGTYGSGLAYGGIADGGPEAVIPLSSPRAGAFINPMAQSVAGQVMNRLQMERMSGGTGGGGATVVTDARTYSSDSNTTVINNPSPIGQTLPDEGRDFVSKVA